MILNMNFLENAGSGNDRGSDGDAMKGDPEQQRDAQPRPWRNLLTANCKHNGSRQAAPAQPSGTAAVSGVHGR
jgi:hypothetical protein